MEEKVLCKANIKGGFKKIILIIYTVIVLAFFILTIRIEHTEYTYYDDITSFNWFGDIEFYSTEYGIDWWGLLEMTIIFLILMLPVVYQIIVRKSCTNCNLTLTENKIYGSYKWIFKNESIQIPMEKLDNIIIRNNFWDKVRGGGGSTLRIASNSGFVNFPCVQNAKEFTDLALKQLELFRKNNEASKAVTVDSADGTIADKLQSLQKLKEQGILSDSEFESKKSELLAKL